MAEWLGELAAEFYQELIRFLRVKKHAVLSNMRSYAGDGGPEQVWNQACFWYQAWYRENADTRDEKDMLIFFDLRANLDKPPPTTGYPAEITGNDIKPKDDDSLYFGMECRIQFDGAGKIVVKSKKNEWRHHRNAYGEELYVPSNLAVLAKPGSTRETGTPFALGNKYVGTELVSGGLLKIHRRF
jgi:hypothetical protein